MKELNDKDRKDMNPEKVIKKLKEEYDEEEIEEMKKDYGEHFDRVFDDSELDGIEESNEEIILTEDEEKEFLNSIANF